MAKRKELQEVVTTGEVEVPQVKPDEETADTLGGLQQGVWAYRAGRRPDSRKDTVLWPDQHVELDRLAWQLSRRRPPGVGERITSNTLLRVAADLLLSQRDQLEGTSEAELRASVLRLDS